MIAFSIVQIGVFAILKVSRRLSSTSIAQQTNFGWLLVKPKFLHNAGKLFECAIRLAAGNQWCQVDRRVATISSRLRRVGRQPL